MHRNFIIRGLSNKTHLEFMKKIVDFIKECEVDNVEKNELLDEFIEAVLLEERLYRVMQESYRIKELLAADCERSNIINSINLIAKAYEHESLSECLLASSYLRNQLHKYNNHIRIRSYETSTLVIKNFICEVTSTNAIQHVWNLRLGPLVEKLQRANQRVSNLIFASGEEGLHNYQTFSETRSYTDRHYELFTYWLETSHNLGEYKGLGKQIKCELDSCKRM